MKVGESLISVQKPRNILNSLWSFILVVFNRQKTSDKKVIRIICNCSYAHYSCDWYRCMYVGTLNMSTDNILMLSCPEIA